MEERKTQERKGTPCAKELKKRREEKRRVQKCMTGSKGLCNICQHLKLALEASRIDTHEKKKEASAELAGNVIVFTAANQIHR